MTSENVVNKEEMQEYQKQLIEGVQGVLSSDKWKEYLTVQSKFHKFSFNNTIMILLQNPSATMVMGKKKWNDLNREVIVGEEPIKVFAPKFKTYNKDNKGKQKVEISKFSKGDVLNVKGEIIKQDFKGKNGYGIYLMEIDQMNYDDMTGYLRVVSATEELEIGGIYRLDGVIDTYKNLKQLKVTDIECLGKASKKAKGQILTGFQLVDLYDLSQTEGDDLPEICEDITGDSEQAQLILDILPKIVDIPIVEEDIEHNGYFSPSEQKIGIKMSLSLNHKAKTGIHEYSHYVMDKLKAGGLDLSKYTKDTKTKKGLYAVEEVIVESIAFMVCKYYNIDTSKYSFEYVASWSGNVSKVKEVGGLIQKYFSKIIEKMEAAKNEILGIDTELQAEAM